MNMLYRTSILSFFLFIVSATASAADIKAGKSIFNELCIDCHGINADVRLAPNLKYIGERRDATWLDKWLKNPSEVLKYDDYAKSLLENNIYSLTMPTLPVMQDDKKRADVIAYLLSAF